LFEGVHGASIELITVNREKGKQPKKEFHKKFKALGAPLNA